MKRPSSTSSLPYVTLAELAHLLEGRGVSARCEPADTAAHVQGMTVDSREVRPRNLFVCKGAAFRPAFLASAVEAGTAAYLCSDDPELLAELTAAAPTCPRLVVSDVRRAMALVAPAIYDHPERALTVCGITGTKGKSTVAYMLRSILLASGDVPSILGSIETDDGVESYESHNTTPEAPELWRHLRNTVDAGRTRMVMEVSSQGLKYDRVLGLPFDIACFLNIGRDHISSVEHPTFEDYFASKLRIFEHAETAVVNLATEHVDEVLAAASHAQRLVTVRACHEGTAADGLSNAGDAPGSASADAITPTFEAKDIRSMDKGLAFTVIEHDTQGTPVVATPITLGMAGLFNVDNALAAIACARLMGVDYAAIAAGLAHVRVPGRMELVPSPDGKVLAIVDYAHNELSFETLFSSVKREYPGRRVIALFGAPGGKAQERREALPRVASKYADLIIYTEEDPAHERVEDICAELAAHTPAGVAHEIICDRTAAIERAVEVGRSCPEGAVLLLLAKGDETRQHRGDDYPEVESDLSIARRLLSVAC